MSTFETPQPITAVVEVVAGRVRLVASDRADTVVDVRPHDPNRASDVRIAEQTRVDLRSGTLTVTAGRRFIPLGLGGAVDVDVALPSGSRLRASSASADIHADGEYSDCTFSTASGDLDLDTISGAVKADTASGAITIAATGGTASVSTASGSATIGRLDGDLKFRSASGDLNVRQLSGDLHAQTASGAVVVAEALNGIVSVQTGSGDVEVGIARGTAARVDVRTRSGVVRNELAQADGPAEGDDTLTVGVRSASGDVVMRRATADAVS